MRTERSVVEFCRIYFRRLVIGLVLVVLVVVMPPSTVEAKIAGLVALPVVLLLVQAAEELVRRRSRAVGYDPLVPLRVRNERDVRALRREADLLLAFHGDSSAFRSSAQIANQVSRLEVTESGRAALSSLLDDSSPVVRLIAAEAVMDGDAAAARRVLAEIVAEPAYYDWILERATSDLARLNEGEGPA